MDNNYWDCECEKDFIHSRFQSLCTKCDTYRDESPPSRVNEVLELYFVPGKEVTFQGKQGKVISSNVEKQTLKINFGSSIEEIQYLEQ